MDESSRLTDQKYTELEYLFQTIEMAKSGQEYKNFRDDTAASLTALATTPPAAQFLDLPLQQEDDLNDSGETYAWNLQDGCMMRRLRRHRRFTVSHGTTPPAPPSTPTSSSSSSSMMLASSSPSSSMNNNVGGGGASNTAEYDSDCFNFNLLYILDYAPKYKKKLKEQQRTDSELAELFKVVTITGSSDKSSHSTNYASSAAANKMSPEHGVSSASRNIRKPDSSTKIFKIHRTAKEFFRDLDEEEDSVSAPEHDGADGDTHQRRLLRPKPMRRAVLKKRQRRFARFELQESMDEVVDTFDAAMSFADA